jgi:hypothetical protein
MGERAYDQSRFYTWEQMLAVQAREAIKCRVATNDEMARRYAEIIIGEMPWLKAKFGRPAGNMH